jgi:uncharacterized membrane protein (DUF373 family)
VRSMPDQTPSRRTPPHARDTDPEGPFWSWSEIRRGTPVRVLVDVLQYAIGLVLLVLAGVVLVRSFIDFLDSPGGYPGTLISAVDGVLVVIILLDILRTVLTHLEGWEFPFRPFLVIGIIAAVRDILAVSTRLTLSSGGGASVPQSLVELGTSAGVVLILAVALWLTRAQVVESDIGPTL